MNPINEKNHPRYVHTLPQEIAAKTKRDITAFCLSLLAIAVFAGVAAWHLARVADRAAYGNTIPDTPKEGL